MKQLLRGILIGLAVTLAAVAGSAQAKAPLAKTSQPGWYRGCSWGEHRKDCFMATALAYAPSCPLSSEVSTTLTVAAGAA